MFKSLATLVIVSIFTTLSYNQDIGCSPARYTDDVFTDLNMTTVVYGENINSLNQNQELSMDIYEPDNDPVALRPLILLVHGGSFVSGDKTQMAPYCELIAHKGYVAATVQYRLWSWLNGQPNAAEATATSVGAVQDLKAAVRYFYKQAQEGNPYKIDTTKIFIGGYSAGAVTAIGTAYIDMGDDLPLGLTTIINAQGGLDGESGNQGYSQDFIGVLNMSGGIFDANYINTGDVPIVSFHGTADAIVPYETGLANGLVEMDGSKVIDDRMEFLDVDHTLYTVEGGGHVDIYTDDAYLVQRTEFLTGAFTFFKNMICPLVDVEDFEQVDNWTNISPNPASENIILNWEEALKHDITIYNALGQVVYAKTNRDNKMEIPVNDFSKGLYFLQIIHGTSKQYIESQKLIIE